MTKEFATLTIDKIDKKVSLIEDKINEIAEILDDAGVDWHDAMNEMSLYTLFTETNKLFSQLSRFRDYAQDAIFKQAKGGQ